MHEKSLLTMNDSVWRCYLSGEKTPQDTAVKTDVNFRMFSIKQYIRPQMIQLIWYWKWILYCVSVHPVIQVPNQLVGAPLGTDVTLECYVEASPKSINYWVRDTGKC